MLLKLCICVAIAVSALLPWDELQRGRSEELCLKQPTSTLTGPHGSKPVQDRSQNRWKPLKRIQSLTHWNLEICSTLVKCFFLFLFFFSSPMNAYKARHCSLCFPAWEWVFYVWVLLVYLIREQLPKWKVQQAHLMWTAHVMYTFKKRHFQTSNYSML